jgi:hypothetical protein
VKHLSLVATVTLGLLFAPPPGNAVDPLPDRPGTSLEITADRLRTGDGEGAVLAEGHVVLSAGRLRLRTEMLLLDLESGSIALPLPVDVSSPELILSGASGRLDLRGHSIELREPRLRTLEHGGLRLGGAGMTCANGSCVIEAARGTACPHDPAGYEVTARRMTVHGSGDVDLTRAALSLDGVKVIAIPWIRIRPAGKAGFLPPRLGWDRSGGLVIGPAGHLPLGDHAYAQGHVAARTSQGMESSSRLVTDHTDLEVGQLLDGPDGSVRVRARSRAPISGASLAADLDLASDRRIIDDMAIDPMDRAISHTASRGLVGIGGDPLLFESQLTYLQAFSPHGRPETGILTPATSLSAAVAPIAAPGWLWPSLRIDLARFDTASALPAPDASGSTVPPHLRLSGSPSIVVPAALGPFSAAARVASSHVAWLPDRQSGERGFRHALMAGADVALPFIGNLGALRHLVTPTLTYRATPLVAGASPGWTADWHDRTRIGHGIEAGLGTSLFERGSSATPMARLDVYERIDLPGIGASAGPAYLFVDLAAGPRWLEVSLSGSLDHSRPLPSAGALLLGSHDRHGSGLLLGAYWYSPGRGAHVDGRWIATALPTWSDGPLADPGQALELQSQGRAAFTRSLAGVAGARIGLVPRSAMHALWYGLELSSSCGCLRLGLIATHRLDEAVPDVMATFSLASP